METGAVYRPTYKSAHRAFVSRVNRCEKALAALKNVDGVYANDIRRCAEMYRRVVEAIEKDQP